MARVALDADVVIAFLDPSDAQHQQAVELLREHLASGDDILIAATGLRRGDRQTPPSTGQTARSISSSPRSARMSSMSTVLSRDELPSCGGAHGALRLPDALSLATALVSDARLLTLDRALQRIADRERDGLGRRSGLIAPTLSGRLQSRRRGDGMQGYQQGDGVRARVDRLCQQADAPRPAAALRLKETAPEGRPRTDARSGSALHGVRGVRWSIVSDR